MDREDSKVRPGGLIPPWQDPEQELFWRARAEDQRISVKLDQTATEWVWRAYKQGGSGFVPMSFDGTLVDPEGSLLTYTEAILFCHTNRAFVYSMHRRRAWRIVWHHANIEQRTLDNYAFETVEVLGYKGLSDQWKDRPKAKLFANDF